MSQAHSLLYNFHICLAPSFADLVELEYDNDAKNIEVSATYPLIRWLHLKQKDIHMMVKPKRGLELNIFQNDLPPNENEVEIFDHLSNYINSLVLVIS